MISDDSVMKISLKTLLIMKRIINLNIDVNKDEEIVISSLNVSNDRFIIGFKLNAFEAAIFDEIFFEIEMELNKLLIFFSIITYFF